MFLLLPFYALPFAIFYWRSRVYYAQHVIHALHIDSFAFSVLALMLMTPINGTGLAINLAGMLNDGLSFGSERLNKFAS